MITINITSNSQKYYSIQQISACTSIMYITLKSLLTVLHGYITYLI